MIYKIDIFYTASHKSTCSGIFIKIKEPEKTTKKSAQAGKSIKPLQTNSTAKRKNSQSVKPSEQSRLDELLEKAHKDAKVDCSDSAISTIKSSIIKVRCPACGEDVCINSINVHLDECLVNK
ncbi:hypothetical protein GJ496_003128 [Pomphorhynchus laevis]|nr:hypothetical protein GJ496_003128 [Pomphorhynchus laevis]